MATGNIPFTSGPIETAVIENNEQNVQPVKDTFWFQPSQLDRSRWNQQWPYQLLILSATTGIDGKTYYQTIAQFTLPISPQELTIEMPIASRVSATLNGIVEHHGGAPFRDIMFNGTTGINPIKTNSTGQDSPTLSFISNTASGIFGGTASAIQATIQAGSRAVSGLFSQSNVLQDIANLKSTGYYQFRLLQKFLEYYVETKKVGISNNVDGSPVNKDLRLGFAIYKDEAVYLMTGVKFTMRKSVGSPMEYNYAFQGRAWKRLDPKQVGSVNAIFDVQLPARAPNLYSALLTRFSAVTDTINGTNSVIQALVQDPQNDFNEISRETGLFLKSVASTAFSIADLPNALKNLTFPAIINSWRTIRDNDPTLPSFPPDILVNGASNIIGGSNPATFAAVTQAQVGSSIQQINQASGIPELTQTSNLTLAQVNDILGKITPKQLQLPPKIVEAIQNEQNRVLSFTRQDFEDKFIQVRNVMLNFSDAIGLGDFTFDETYSRTPLPQIRFPSDDEYNALYGLNEMCLILEHLSASRTIDPPAPTSLEYVAGLAQASGIAFTVPTSKFAVPFPYGFTLEQLALKYLNDPNRWHEIATLNGLHQPYIDETGFKLGFLVNGNAANLWVNDITNLFIGQPVWVSSNTIPRNSRRIINIVTVYDGYYQLTLSGNSDLASYKISDQAILEAYLPGTVNSQQLIYIPSPQAANPDLETKPIPGIDIFDPLLEVGGTDLLLTPDGDLVLTADGSAQIAYGLQNIIQNIKLALTTPKGSLLQHPDYGLNLEVGQSVADLSAEDIAKSISGMFVDPTFATVLGVSVDVAPPGTSIRLSLQLASINQNVDVNFNLK